MKRLPRTVIGDTTYKLGLVLSTLVIVWCPAARASQGDFSSIKSFLNSTLKDEDQLALEARGDLNGDGLEDWAGVIHRRKSNPPSTSQLYVLLRLRRGGYRVAERSKEEPAAGTGCCWVENLEIRRSSIYVQNNAKTAVSMQAATHQFKLYTGGWRLIGVRVHDVDLDSDVSVETDMNLLTGSVIEKRQQGDNKPETGRRRRRFAASFLKDFDFHNGFGIESKRVRQRNAPEQRR